VSLFKQAAKVYLVTQVGVPELRNSFRLISEFFPSNVTNLEVVLNRYTANSMGISEEEIAKAITKPISWKIPSDYATVRQMQTSATPLVLENSPISRKIEQMAREACGLPAVPEKKKARTFFG
jgi:Flp pilus assembly CpaE family ATPase